MTPLMQGKTVLVSGATSGIGQAIAVGLAKMDARVIITGRNPARGRAAVADIQQASGNRNVDFLMADMASQAEIHRLADLVLATYPQLDVLINNVGVSAPQRQLSADGIELNFAVNHLAGFLLTQRLLPLLKHSAPARIIQVTGGLVGKLNRSDLLVENSPYSGFAAYSHSKTIMMAASYEFARRLDGTNVTLNVAYPGSVPGTHMRSQPSTAPIWLRLVRRFVDTSAEEAAHSSLYLASSPTVEGVTGQYFNQKAKRLNWPEAVYEATLRAEIWELSQRLAHLTPETMPAL